MSRFHNALVGSALLFAAACGAKKPMAVTLIVTSTDGKPVATAYIQHPEAVERFHANPEDGRWSGTQVILTNGTVVPFVTNSEIPLQVSAPGYKTSMIKVVPNPRGTNEFPVVLEPDPQTPVDPEVLPGIEFRKDVPLDK
jgi:hypothetical protein